MLAPPLQYRFSLYKLQYSFTLPQRTNVYPSWSRKTCLFRKPPLPSSNKGSTNVSELDWAYSWHRPMAMACPCPREHTAHKCNEWQTEKQSCWWQQHPGGAHGNVARTIWHMLRNRQDVLHRLYRRSVTFRAFTTDSDCWEAEPCPLMLAGSFAEQ